MLPAPHVTLSMSGKIASILGPHYGWSLWKNEDLLADLVEFFCSGSAIQRFLWARLEKRVPVSEAEKKRRRTEAANAVRPLSVVDLVLLKPVRTPVAILGSLGVCIYVPASRHWLISYSPIHVT